MTPQALAIGLILILLIMVGVYLTRRKMPVIKTTPNMTTETYLYYDPRNPVSSLTQATSIATGYQGTVSTPGEISYYAFMGGTVGWCGISSTGSIYSVPGAQYSPNAPVTSQPCCKETPYGVWITGPKIVAGTKNVSPFNCRNWYQPPISPANKNLDTVKTDTKV